MVAGKVVAGEEGEVTPKVEGGGMCRSMAAKAEACSSCTCCTRRRLLRGHCPRAHSVLASSWRA
eukprot:scaffold318897_cov14-Tisochrysis_lutea.AAC.1